MQNTNVISCYYSPNPIQVNFSSTICHVAILWYWFRMLLCGLLQFPSLIIIDLSLLEKVRPKHVSFLQNVLCYSYLFFGILHIWIIILHFQSATNRYKMMKEQKINNSNKKKLNLCRILQIQQRIQSETLIKKCWHCYNMQSGFMTQAMWHVVFSIWI
jgi:hypothetical protein